MVSGANARRDNSVPGCMSEFPALPLSNVGHLQPTRLRVLGRGPTTSFPSSRFYGVQLIQETLQGNVVLQSDLVWVGYTATYPVWTLLLARADETATARRAVA